MSEALALPAVAVLHLNLLLGRGLNDRVHWATRAKRAKHERGSVIMAFYRHRMSGGVLPVAPYEVTLTRVYSGREREMDDDNWIGACKGTRDQVAAELHVNDGDRQAIRFTYSQEAGPHSELRITIHNRAQFMSVACHNRESVSD